MIYNEKMRDLEEENRKLKEELEKIKKENYLIPKGNKSCYSCWNCEDLAGKVTFIGEPPAPYCRLDKSCFPYCGDLCKDFHEKINSIPFLEY